MTRVYSKLRWYWDEMTTCARAEGRLASRPPVPVSVLLLRNLLWPPVFHGRPDTCQRAGRAVRDHGTEAPRPPGRPSSGWSSGLGVSWGQEVAVGPAGLCRVWTVGLRREALPAWNAGWPGPGRGSVGRGRRRRWGGPASEWCRSETCMRGSVSPRRSRLSEGHQGL